MSRTKCYFLPVIFPSNWPTNQQPTPTPSPRPILGIGWTGSLFYIWKRTVLFCSPNLACRLFSIGRTTQRLHFTKEVAESTLNHSIEVLQEVNPMKERVELWSSNMNNKEYSAAAYDQAVISAGEAGTAPTRVHSTGLSPNASRPGPEAIRPRIVLEPFN